jgi:hypothetical protein
MNDIMTKEEAKNYSLHGDQEGFYYQEAREKIRNGEYLEDVHFQALVSANNRLLEKNDGF